MLHPKSSQKAQPESAATKANVPGPLPVPRELLSLGVELDPEFELERQRRMEALKAKLLGMLARGEGEQAIDQVMGLLVDMERENDRLAWRVLRATRYRFGSSSERLSHEELGQLLLALGGEEAEARDNSNPDVPAPEEPEQTETADSAEGECEAEQPEQPKKKRRRRVRSMQVAPSVERNVREVQVPEEERCCALCGREKKTFGSVEHQVFRFVPAKIVVDVELREKRGCEFCRKDVSVAPRSEVPSVTRKVDASLLGKLVCDKCALGLPLDRQRRELARMGLDAPDKTLQSYWAYTLDLLEPVALATLSSVFASPIVGADDSHLKTLTNSGKRKVFRGHLWCFVGTDGVVGRPEMVAYGYTPSWQATDIADWFASIPGFVQCDGYAGYSREVELEDNDGEQSIIVVPDERRLGCGMHIRSKFHAALLSKDKRAAIPLKLFKELYDVEAACKQSGLDAQARGEERRRRSLPLLDELDAWVDEVHPKLLPKSPLRRATTYARNQREFFRRCFDDGRFEIDNGRVERRIRLFASARRAFLSTGSERGGERLAVGFTLVDNCLLLGIDPYAYLVDVIRKLEAGWPLRRLSELVPQRWAAEHSAQ